MSQAPQLKVGVIIQARMGATRLPGKPLLKVLNKTLIEYQFERLKKIKHPVTIILATTTNENDKVLVSAAKSANISYFEGSEKDVLDRYLKAARHFEVDVIIRVTADCPVIDPHVIDEAITHFLAHYPEYDYFSNTLKRSYPRGMDVEVFKRRALEEAHQDAFFEEEREHVTPFLYRHPERFKLGHFSYISDVSQHRWTVDTKEDFELIQKLIEALYPSNKAFTLEDLLNVIKRNPDWSSINSHIEQKKV